MSETPDKTVSETPDKNSDSSLHQEIEQTVILASDDEEMDSRGSPSVILGSDDDDDGLRGCAQTVEPTLLLSGSLSDEADSVRQTKEDSGKCGKDRPGKYLIAFVNRIAKRLILEKMFLP